MPGALDGTRVLDISTTTAGAYLVHVFGYSGAQGAYSLTVAN